MFREFPPEEWFHRYLYFHTANAAGATDLPMDRTCDFLMTQHQAISASLTDLVQCHQQCPLTSRDEPWQIMGRGLVCTSVGLGSSYVFKVFIQIFTKMLTGRKIINGIVMAVYRMRERETMKHKNMKMLAKWH